MTNNPSPAETQPPVKHYVLGFLFDPGLTFVALILKRRPAWQAGKFNGIGGKVEAGETPLDAMRREGREELGLLDLPDWEEFASFSGRLDEDAPAAMGYVVHVFCAAHADAEGAGRTTDEGDIHLKVCTTHVDGALHNVNWLIAMARARLSRQCTNRYYIHEEPAH